jgi:hypothetical protein
VVIWDATYTNIGIISPGGCGDKVLFSDWLVSLYAKNIPYLMGQEANKGTGDAANWLDAQGIPAIRVRLPYHDPEGITREELKIHEDNNIRAVQAVIDQLSQ